MGDQRKSLDTVVGGSINTKHIIRCVLCDNVLELNLNESVPFPYICDECKEAIAYVKELKKRNSCGL